MRQVIMLLAVVVEVLAKQAGRHRRIIIPEKRDAAEMVVSVILLALQLTMLVEELEPAVTVLQ